MRAKNQKTIPPGEECAPMQVLLPRNRPPEMAGMKWKEGDILIQIYKPLEVDNLRNLAEEEFEHVDPLIEHLLPGVGTFLFCGSSKIGKSWLAFDLGLHICSGKKFWKSDGE